MPYTQHTPYMQYTQTHNTHIPHAPQTQYTQHTSYIQHTHTTYTPNIPHRGIFMCFFCQVHSTWLSVPVRILLSGILVSQKFPIQVGHAVRQQGALSHLPLHRFFIYLSTVSRTCRWTGHIVGILTTTSRKATSLVWEAPALTCAMQENTPSCFPCTD